MTIGYFDGQAPAEVFINLNKQSGSELEAIARDGAILVSICLQHGCPLDVIQKAISRTVAGEPRTVIGAAVDTLKKGLT